MFELKPLSAAAIPRAIAKADRYRLLKEPHEAESICRDILAIDPDNQEVLAMLVLAITDQFTREVEGLVAEAQKALGRIRGEYERAYYAGIVSERWVKAQLEGSAHAHTLTGWFLEALDWYQRAQVLSPAGNDDAVLRWNTCVRLLQRNPDLLPADEGPDVEFSFSDGPPPVR